MNQAANVSFASRAVSLYKPGKPQGDHMPTLSDNRRKKIQAKQRKAGNAAKRASKIAKRERNKPVAK
jgi:hypothetical protein